MSSDYVVVCSGAPGLPSEVVDSDLSIGAIGLLTVILLQPDGADLSAKQFVERGMSQVVVEGFMQELVNAGHRHEFTVSSQGDENTKVVVFSDVSISRETANERFFQAHAPSSGDQAKRILK